MYLERFDFLHCIGPAVQSVDMPRSFRIVIGAVGLMLLAAPMGCENPFGKNKRVSQTHEPPRHVHRDAQASKSSSQDDFDATDGKNESDGPTDTVKKTSSTNETSADAANGPTPSAQAIHSDGLVIDDETVTIEDVLEPLMPTLQQMCKTLAAQLYYKQASEMIRQRIVESVAQHLIYRRAKKDINEQIEPALNKEVDKIERERINREFHGIEAEYDNYLHKSNRTRADVRKRLRAAVVVESYLRERLVKRVQYPRKKDLLDYYHQHIDDYSTSERREMLLIDIPIASFLDMKKPLLAQDQAAAEQKARSEIEAAAKALRDGKKFEEVAKEYSRGLHKDEGGSWGMISTPLSGRWQKPSEKLFELKDGEVSPIIEDSKSFFIVKAGKTERKEVKSFQEMQPQIAQRIQDERFHKLRADFLEAELRKSTISPIDPFFSQVMNQIPKPKSSARASQ